MCEDQCFYEAQRKGRDLRRALYQQELCRPLGFPVVRRKTKCQRRSNSQVTNPTCGASYRKTRPDFLHHHDFKPACPDRSPVTVQCEYLSFYPPVPVFCSDAVRPFPAAMPAETILSGFRNAHSGPGFQAVTGPSPCQMPCDYISNFQIVHTMVNPCGPELAFYTPPVSLFQPTFDLPTKPMSCVRCTASYVPDQVHITELTDDDCQQMGLCGYRRRRQPQCRPVEKVFTSLPGIGSGSDRDDPPKPWRDPCGGRIYYRLSDNDFIQQWGSPS